MKKFIFVLFALVQVQAMATRPTEKTILQFNEMSIDNEFNTHHTITVKVDDRGLVSAIRENNVEYFVAFINMADVETIRNLIEDANQTNVVVAPPPFCDAIPERSVEYSALNTEVLLLTDTSPCGGSAGRDNAATNELIEILNALTVKASHTNTLLAEINA